MENEKVLVLLSDDLIFNSRISAPARDEGATVRSPQTSMQPSWQRESSATCVIVDLALAGSRIGDLLTSLCVGRPSTNHRLRSACRCGRATCGRRGGCDIVLPRSKFVEALDNELPRWLAPRTLS